VHSRGNTWQYTTSEYGRLITNTATSVSTPASRTFANPKSTGASPGGWLSGRNTSFRPTFSSRTASFADVYPPLKPCSAFNRSQIRFAV
jgi:hypothetical protein